MKSFKTLSCNTEHEVHYTNQSKSTISLGEKQLRLLPNFQTVFKKSSVNELEYQDTICLNDYVKYFLYGKQFTVKQTVVRFPPFPKNNILIGHTAADFLVGEVGSFNIILQWSILLEQEWDL